MQLNVEQQSLLELLIEIIDYLQLECKRSPRYSSPGSDGIPYYQLLLLLLKFPPIQPLKEQVYIDALIKGIFPDPWNVSLITLLYKKKNDPNSAGNYRRPISLCNKHRL
ncbi:hypothetical protein MAM1_0799d11251 [Mucor ambiguus]|uniref:Uncharacterized protein n=1 Tax=Mucor ambiguus TaxID=91626 RepID=A0A0C9LZ60_9FUNG|nr:hypothetical protein MAM1_0799d11251 [Mucor ambiguus]